MSKEISTRTDFSRLILDAKRYRYLRGADIDSIGKGGVFAGKTPDNVVINGDDLDKEIDALISLEAIIGVNNG